MLLRRLAASSSGTIVHLKESVNGQPNQEGPNADPAAIKNEGMQCSAAARNRGLLFETRVAPNPLLIQGSHPSTIHNPWLPLHLDTRCLRIPGATFDGRSTPILSKKNLVGFAYHPRNLRATTRNVRNIYGDCSVVYGYGGSGLISVTDSRRHPMCSDPAWLRHEG